MSRRIRVGRFLSWLGGADENALRQVPSERGKFTQMALVLLTTAALASLSMAFALHDGLDVSWPWAVISGVAWGFVIINLDRLLVLSMGTTRAYGRMLLMAAPRVVMAVVLSAVVSTPLVLRVFQDEIRAEIHLIQLERSGTQKESIGRSAETKRKADLEKEIKALESILAGNLPADFSTPELKAAKDTVAALRKELAGKEKTRNDKRDAWQCELHGGGEKCAGASSKSGDGILAQAKEQEFEQAESAYRDVSEKLRKAEADLAVVQQRAMRDESNALAEAQEDARRRLPGLKAELQQVTGRLDAMSEAGFRTNTEADGLPAQIQALFSAGEKDGSLHWAHIMVFSLFFMIELLPVLVKLLLNFGPMSAYESFIKVREEALTKKFEADHDLDRTIAEGHAEVRKKIEEDMRRREEELGVQANAYVADEMRVILESALHEWGEQVRGKLGDLEDEAVAKTNGRWTQHTPLNAIIALPDENRL
ncbi:DUF4407 domain-containing protein [Planomonospora corallina]|uniref:DUF4407 domain-containing protein n=1 Tax=Planomonospora corallina TaxID=1806052 RepID=A0ABV8IGG4_9ACTN